MAALEHVDRVELEQAEPIDHEVQLTGAHGIRMLPPEALGGEGDAARLRCGD